MNSARQRSIHAFEQQFDSAPQFVVVVPGRVNLIGEHVDYNDGIVLPMAIDRYLVMAVGDHDSDRLTVMTELDDHVATVALDGTVADDAPAWSRFIGSVVEAYAAHARPSRGLCCAIASDIPSGAGLSSSAALTVATATIMEHLTGCHLDKPALCRDAEWRAVGVPCGLMDPLACCQGRAGHALRFDCRTGATRAIPLWGDDLSLLVVDSGVQRELASGHYARRRGQCEAAAAAVGCSTLRDVTLARLDDIERQLDDTHRRRARHVITEIARTRQASDLLERRDWGAFGALMRASHQSLRDDFDVSCAEVDTLVDIIDRQPGVMGCRMTGAGFGGCVIALLSSDAVAEVREQVLRDYADACPRQARAWLVHAVDGASLHAVSR